MGLPTLKVDGSLAQLWLHPGCTRDAPGFCRESRVNLGAASTTAGRLRNRSFDYVSLTWLNCVNYRFWGHGPLNSYGLVTAMATTLSSDGGSMGVYFTDTGTFEESTIEEASNSSS